MIWVDHKSSSTVSDFSCFFAYFFIPNRFPSPPGMCFILIYGFVYHKIDGKASEGYELSPPERQALCHLLFRVGINKTHFVFCSFPTLGGSTSLSTGSHHSSRVSEPSDGGSDECIDEWAGTVGDCVFIFP